jgi:Uma2 family endonuclease
MRTAAQYSLAQYERMVDAGVFDGKFRQHVELIRGEIVQMSPIGYRHANVVDEIDEISREILSREQVRIRIQATLRLPGQESSPEPNVQWLRRRDYSQRHPEPDDVFLVIEVAETSIEEDTGDKAQLYAAAGIADYWVVNIPDECVEVFRDPQPAGYRTRKTYRGDDAIHPVAFPAISIRAAELLGNAE